MDHTVRARNDQQACSETARCRPELVALVRFPFLCALLIVISLIATHVAMPAVQWREERARFPVIVYMNLSRCRWQLLLRLWKACNRSSMR
jgi:hypothetical protein